jgi:hypothetical protein
MVASVADLRRPHLVLVLCLAFAASGCKSEPERKTPAQAAPSARPKTPDRLKPGELAEGSEEVFGFRVPRRMRIEAHFGDSVHLAGPIRPEDVANYVRERVQVERVEIGAARTIFPHARIKQGDPARAYEFQVIATSGDTKLQIRDLTPPPAQPGLSEAERWRQAGMTPDGKALPDLK